ncbi:Acyl-CoA dehydrogenase family member 9, mitochondrial [Aphelenchoides besseyi]|nr:Acyl-CoA dehydrogenase family member 9, mitochondrial [Aphelenchoides besseyi]
MRSLRQFRSFRTSSQWRNKQVPVERPKYVPPAAILEDKSIPIEKKSLSRGLAMNKFEKDFLIYPEYTNIEDLDAIKGFLVKLGRELDLALKPDRTKLDGTMKVLIENNVFASLVHDEFGGLGFGNKDKLLLSETLGSRDLSLFMNVNVVQLAVRILETYGFPEQREKYLPLLASGQYRPALCILDDTVEDAEETKVTTYQGHEGVLDGRKINVINAEGANLLLVIAKSTMGSVKERFCYVIENPPESGSIVIKPKTTQGLLGARICDVEFHSVRVKADQVVGDATSAPDILSDYLTTNRTYYGAAVVGFLKQLCDELCHYANSHLYGTKPLSLNPAAQTTMSNLCMEIYVLETMVYYLGGLQDEGLFLLNDVEHSIIQRCANRVLRQGIITITEIAGLSAVDTTFDYEKKIRDAVTLLSMNLPEMTLIRSISLPVIDSYVQNSSEKHSLSARLNFKNIFFGKRNSAYHSPLPTHFIAEHAHPSLENCCRGLEEHTSRFSHLLSKVCSGYGKNLKKDYYTLSSIANILELNLGMMSTISRASRSYSIGIRNSDLELWWTMFYCTQSLKSAINQMDGLQHYMDLVTTNPTITAIGSTAFESKGYPIENVVERNCKVY